MTEIRNAIARGYEVSRNWWDQVQASGVTEPQSVETVVANLDADDMEVDGANDMSPYVNIQLRHKIMRTLDRQKLHSQRLRFEHADAVEDIQRLDDLRDHIHQNHDWWKTLNHNTNSLLSANDWVTAMRLRLGAVHSLSDNVCAICGVRMLDSKAYHALCCARSQSTIGHNRVRDIIAGHFAKADPGTAIEVAGLCPQDPLARPADVLSRAPHNTRIVAVDIGIK